MIIALQTLVFFRESLFAVIDRFLRPYYRHFSLTFHKPANVPDDDESEDHVFAEYDDEKGVVFYPPVYLQRYAAVTDCLMDERWIGKLEKVIDFGYHDTSFIKYLKEIPGIKTIYGIDIESIPLRCSSGLLACDDYVPKSETPLKLTLFQGNAADPDYRLIGCDAVVAIEMIEHMLPHDLERLIHTIFGFIKPWIAVITTPNGDFNPLFKRLEKNGLRRLDHFFEWSREQFHDWCSNIVTRYPQYTVSCRGIGPGPPDTVLLGCCSQLALFVSKEYHKQQDLNLNSLALIPKVPSINNCEVEYLDSTDNIMENNLICLPNDIESYTELVFSNKQSCVTVVLSPTFSLETLEYCDKTAQCNLDTEVGKNFLMFDEEHMFNIVVPRRRVDHRVYVIEDVNSRLNCTTFQVTKFTKRTQNMLAENKMDAMVHSKEVVDEIRHLTKMLNFNNNSQPVAGERVVWQNFNWGTNAPYWNQYYKTVREFTYPFENKSEECRILDIITDEINRLVDTQYVDFSLEADKLEIPVEHLMWLVQHITDDVNMVKDLLEWNGYTVVGDVVIHSRLVVDALPASSPDEFRENGTPSDWDTDVRSASMSEGSTVVPDYNALDQKVRKLKTMVSADQELDTVVCRLLKLALRTADKRQQPLLNTWMQFKLFDLLTLTENALVKKRQHALKAICYDQQYSNHAPKILSKPEDETANEILNKYRHLVHSSEKTSNSQYIEILEDDSLSKGLLNDSVSELNFNDIIHSPSLVDNEPLNTKNKNSGEIYLYENESSLTRTRVWVEEDVKIIESSNPNAYCKSSDHILNNNVSNKNNLEYKHNKIKSKNKDIDRHKIKEKKGLKAKKLLKNKQSYNILTKPFSSIVSTTTLNKFSSKSRRKCKRQMLYKPDVIPISNTLTNVCDPVLQQTENLICDNSNEKSDSASEINVKTWDMDNSIAVTKNSQFIDIISEDNRETVALRRTIGTDVNESMEFEQETIIGSLTNIMNIDSFCDKCNNYTDYGYSESLYLLDMNEPSTSKGIRHVSMDAQCGPDNTCTEYSPLTATKSFTKTNNIINTLIKIDDSSSNVKIGLKNNDFGTSTDDNAYCTKSASLRTNIGIKIKDSDPSIADRIDEENNNNNVDALRSESPIENTYNFTMFLKSVSNHLKVDDSGSELCNSVTSSHKSPLTFTNLYKNNSDSLIKSSVSRNIGKSRSSSNKHYSKLSCGAVYIHSYRDRKAYEDVVFQGEWQKYMPKSTRKKRGYSTLLPKRILEESKNENKENMNNENMKDNSYSDKEKQPTKQIKRLPIPNTNIKSLKGDRKRPQIKIIRQSTKQTEAPKCNRKPLSEPAKLTNNSVLSKSIKPLYLTKKPSVTFSFNKNESNTQRTNRKSYIPLYLKRKLAKNEIIHTCPQSDSAKILKINQEIPCGLEGGSKFADGNFVNIDFKAPENVSYIVFRNEIEVAKQCSTDCESRSVNICQRLDDSNKLPSSSESLISSADSSPNSIATVRAHIDINTSPDISNCQVNSSKEKNKKYTKKCKSANKPKDKNTDNKENKPESSNKFKESERFNKPVFIKNKNVFRAHISNESSSKFVNSNVSKHKSKTTKANSKITSIPTTSAKNPVDCVGSSRRDISMDAIESRPLMLDKIGESTYGPGEVNMPINPEEIFTSNQDMVKESIINSIVDNISLSEWNNHSMMPTHKSSADTHTSDTFGFMRQIIDERLNFAIEESHTGREIDSETLILGSEKLHSIQNSRDTSYYDVISLNGTHSDEIEIKYFENYEMMDHDNTLSDSVVSNQYDHIIGDDSVITISNSKPTITDLEMLSFKSLTSTPKLSEFFLAESMVSDTNVVTIPDTPLTTSVRDLFERKPSLQIQGPAGALAMQAFSGFSMNAEPITGDQPDRVNLIDSETGSIAADCGRKTTSEELLISGRSSQSYESCLVDDDAVVPNWLFQIISQQQSVVEETEEDSDDFLPMPLTDPESIYDANGNPIEQGMSAGAGAGDGRGIHSDNSEDSSGRGTSLSSSDTSSGPQSEAILIDPTAFTAQQYELPVVPNGGSASAVPFLTVTSDTADTSRAAVADNLRNIDVINSSGDPQILFLPLQATSDVDADISSLDTDVPDSDN